MGGHDLCKRILKTITKSISLFNRMFTYVMEHTICIANHSISYDI